MGIRLPRRHDDGLFALAMTRASWAMQLVLRQQQFQISKGRQEEAESVGLYDMHGNVTEWVLDQYNADFTRRSRRPGSTDPWNKATQPYPHSARGGSWDDDAPPCTARRSADRIARGK